MAWIELPDDEATPVLARLTRTWRQSGRAVPCVMVVMKPSPRTFRAVMGMNSAITFGGSCLERRDEELISTVVSALNDCFY